MAKSEFGVHLGFQCKAFVVSQCFFHYIMMLPNNQICAEKEYLLKV